MNRPSTPTMWLGHPVVTLPVCLLTIGDVYSCFQGNAAFLPAVALVVVANLFVKANTRRTAYVSWKRTWDAMDARAPQLRSPKRARPLLGVVLLVLLGLFFTAHAQDPVYRVALVWLVFSMIVAGIAAFVMRLRRDAANPTAKSMPVSICIAGSLMPVRTGQSAYRALPPHCHALLGR